MIFDVNQTDFPTPRHKAIWDLGRMIIPLDVSLADITDPETREGCTQIYNWTQEYFKAVYDNPDKYSGYSPIGMFRLLSSIAEVSEVENGTLLFNKKYGKASADLKKQYLPDLPLLGIHISEKVTNNILLNDEYPLFCIYFKTFFEKASKKKVNVLDYLVYNDFRVFVPKYKRTFDDLLRVLPDALKGYALEIHEYALSKGAKLEPHKYYSRFIYKYKKQSILGLSKNSGRHTPLDIAVPWGYGGAGSGSFETFMQMVDNQPDKEELTSYILKEICACDACGNKKASERCSNLWKEINGKRRLLALCHRDISKWKAPKSNLIYTDYDIEMLKRMVDIRFEQIVCHTI
jgi:hypothetical protein